MTRVDVYGGAPASLYANDEDGTAWVTQPVGENGEFEVNLSSCDLSSGNTIYFRVTNALLNVPEPETAWRSPYKFKVTTTPPLFVDGSCPVTLDCDYTFSAYGNSGCDEDCTERYDGATGNIRIPIVARTLGTQVTTTSAGLERRAGRTHGNELLHGENAAAAHKIDGLHLASAKEFS